VSAEAKKVIIIGSGMAGLTSARELSRQNIQVEFVEKTDFLGGYAIQYACKAGYPVVLTEAGEKDGHRRPNFFLVISDGVSLYNRYNNQNDSGHINTEDLNG
jgi:succinate dehydrogenase/fumarate reductase flavoprotein subunit